MITEKRSRRIAAVSYNISCQWSPSNTHTKTREAAHSKQSLQSYSGTPFTNKLTVKNRARKQSISRNTRMKNKWYLSQCLSLGQDDSHHFQLKLETKLKKIKQLEFL